MRILTCLLAFFSLPLFAANHIAFIGGGGGPVGDRTIFDADVNRFGSFMKRMPEDTSLSVSFNGGHSRTESRPV